MAKNELPKNMTEYRNMMLKLHMDALKGLVRPADLKEHANMYGKHVASSKVQLEQKVFLKDRTEVEFLKDE
jgi:hypothetical protein